MKKQSKKPSRKPAILQQIKKEVSRNKFVYLLLGAILFLGLFLRVYKTGQILGFYFDQGRDALEIWELLHKGDFFLIGPTTGIAGIFRGPFYYYLIAPFYAFSRGDPVLPANFLSFTTILAAGSLYYLGARAHSRVAGLYAAFLASLSMGLIFSSRWLSNPTPMFLLSTLLLLFMFMVIDGKRWAWAGIAFVAGLSLFHFGSSGEFFYFPAIFVFALWQRKALPELKTLLLSVFLFILTVVPLILFDFKNNHLLSNNIRAFLFEKESFQPDFWVVVQERIGFYYHTFGSVVFPKLNSFANVVLGTSGIALVLFLRKFLKNDKIKTVLLMLISPMIGLFFFQGNEGNIYGYYLTGYYLVFVLLLSIVFGKLWESTSGKGLVSIFLTIFLFTNVPPTWRRLNSDSYEVNAIMLKHQKQAIEWIYNDADGQEFNVDVYVPPVIPYAYDYLFTWYESKLEYSGKVDNQIPLLYTLYEIDPPHPDRINAWHARQAGIGEVKYEETFGGIGVQRRQRLP